MIFPVISVPGTTSDVVQHRHILGYPAGKERPKPAIDKFSEFCHAIPPKLPSDEGY